MSDLISRQAAIDEIRKCRFVVDAIEKIRGLPSAQPTEASCWGCNCRKMERLKEQKTFSEMIHLHDAETHDKRAETHACDLICRQAALKIVAKHIGVDGDRACLIDVGKTYGEIYAMPSAQPEQRWIDAIREVIKCSGSDGFIIVPKDGTEGWDENGVRYTMQPEQRWIPCSERLPDISEHHVSEPCIVYCSNGAYGFAGLEENIFGQVGWNCERDDEYHEPLGEVLAWMPLPEPYAERRTDEAD